MNLYPYDGIAAEDGEGVFVGIDRVQLEQDTAKSVQEEETRFLIDYNRVSSPLIEIVSLPQIHHPSTAAAYVRKIQWILKSIGVCTLGMEAGGLRADVNVSIRRRHVSNVLTSNISSSSQAFGQRVEIKNLSSLKAVEDAIEAERDRQTGVLLAGGLIAGETRGWTLGATQTRKLREKEGDVDYRYLPDPDLPPLVISNVSRDCS